MERSSRIWYVRGMLSSGSRPGLAHGALRKGVSAFATLLAFAIAVRTPVTALLDPEPLVADDISTMETDFAGLRARIPDGARVGWLVPAHVPGQLVRVMAVARYALAPLAIERISAPDCLARGRGACGLDALDLLFAVHFPQVSVRDDAVALGLMDAGAQHGIHLLTVR